MPGGDNFSSETVFHRDRQLSFTIQYGDYKITSTINGASNRRIGGYDAPATDPVLDIEHGDIDPEKVALARSFYQRRKIEPFESAPPNWPRSDPWTFVKPVTIPYHPAYTAEVFHMPEPSYGLPRLKGDPPIEKVNHPNHYGGDTVYETIKVLDAWEIESPYIWQAIKYLSRAGKKPDADYVEDLKKAQFYLNREIKKHVDAQQQVIPPQEIEDLCDADD